MRFQSVQENLPLFRWNHGENFKGKDLSKILSEITDPLTEGTKGLTRSHSFRAAIPSAMGIRGFSESEIQVMQEILQKHEHNFSLHRHRAGGLVKRSWPT